MRHETLMLLAFKYVFQMIYNIKMLLCVGYCWCYNRIFSTPAARNLHQSRHSRCLRCPGVSRPPVISCPGVSRLHSPPVFPLSSPGHGFLAPASPYLTSPLQSPASQELLSRTMSLSLGLHVGEVMFKSSYCYDDGRIMM